MGYILPITHFQYIDYNNRVVSSSAEPKLQPVQSSTAIFPVLLHTKNEEDPSRLHVYSKNNEMLESLQDKIDHKSYKKDFPYHALEKGIFFDRYI